MKESEKIIRFFVIATIWILFVTVTLAGLVTAAEKTEYINSGKETETIICRGTLDKLQSEELGMMSEE